MSSYLIGIDFGTGSGKAAVVNDSLNVHGYACEEYPIIVDHPGFSEHNPSLYWEVACRVVKSAIVKAAINPKDIRGIAVSSALPSMVMVDCNHVPVNNAYNLMDRRATDQVQRLKDTIGEDHIFNISKNRLDDHPSIVNLLWERIHRPDDFKRIYKALTIDGYITLKLTGAVSCNYSGAAFYGVAYNMLERRFDPALLEKIGLSVDLLPPLYPCEAIVGEVTAAAAQQMGLRAGTPVAAGQVDCNAGWSGAGMVDEGDIQMNLGTCGNFGIIHHKPVFDRSMIACAYTIDSANTFITIPTTTTGGQLLRYLRENIYVSEFLSESKTGLDTYDLINREAAVVPVGSDGLIMLPYLMGERTPIWDVQARGAIFGLSLNHTRGHIARAAMEAVAYALYDSFKLIQKSGLTVRAPIVFNEGGAKSVLWRRIITDVFNVPTVLVKNRVGAPLGDALLAGVATGVFKDFSIAKERAEYVDLMEPDGQAHQKYMEYFALYKQIYAHVKEDFKGLARLRG